jgi:hypothetical protein
LRFSVILKAARSILPEDLHLGICLLMALKDISQAKELFLQLPRSIVTLQTAAFYFALKVCIEELPPDDMNVRVNASCADPFKVFPQHFYPYIFFHRPDQPLQLIHLVDQGKLPDCTPTETSREARKLLASFIALQGEFLQTLQLQSLDCGVDPLRFSHDEQYRNDSILGLAM